MKKIWVLDDDKSIRWVFEKALSKANLPCQCFSNTNEAINQFNHESSKCLHICIEINHYKEESIKS